MIVLLWIAAAAVLHLSPRASSTGFALAAGLVLGAGILYALVTPAGR